MRKVKPVLFPLSIIIFAGFLIYQAIYNPTIISFAPTQQPVPTPWPGIQRLSNFGGNGKLLWSPTKPIIAGSLTTLPGCPDWWCAFGNQQSEIFIVDLQTQTKKTIFKTDRSSIIAIGWSSDGKKVLISPEWGDLKSGVWAVDIQGQTPPEFVTDYSFASWSPDESKMAFTDAIGGTGTWYPVVYIRPLA